MHNLNKIVFGGHDLAKLLEYVIRQENIQLKRVEKQSYTCIFC